MSRNAFNTCAQEIEEREDERNNLRMEREMEREYRLKPSGYASADLGACERCGKHCSQHYMQQSRKIGGLNKGWTSSGYGHVECLRNGPWVNAPVVDRA